MMFETDPEVIDVQIKAGLLTCQGSAFGFLNNLFDKLPESNGEGLVQEAGLWDVVLGDITDDALRELHSVRYLQATHRDFFDDIYDAVNQAGIDWAELARLQREYHQAPETELTSSQEALCDFILPVYRELRMMGYSHYDLWC